MRRLGSLTEYNITLTAASSFFQAAESLSLLARTCKSVLLLTCYIVRTKNMWISPSPSK
jgi:hypothetical protein